jgi:Na+/melibiose symporter-like transporter
LGNYRNKESLATGQGFFEEQPIYFVVVVVVVVVTGLFVLLDEEIAAATATTATAAATMPAVIPPVAAPVAGPAPEVPEVGSAGAGAGVCASALPATNTDAIKTASAFFIFLSCINLGKNRIRSEILTAQNPLSTKIRKLQA